MQPELVARPAAQGQRQVRALAEEGAQPLAGGTDLLPNLRRGLGTPRVLVDLMAVAALDAISVQRDGSLRVGAAATLAALAGQAAVRTGWPALATAAGLVAGPTHREAATLGGNLCQDTRCVFYNQSEWWRAGNGYCLKLRGDKCHVVVKSDRCYATYHGDVAPANAIVGDDDPLDICVLTERSIAHGNILVEAIPIGGFRMIDGDEADDKIIAVLAGDLVYGKLTSVAQCPQPLIDRLRHYFLTYKQAPDETESACRIVEVYGADEARAVIQASSRSRPTQAGIGRPQSSPGPPGAGPPSRSR